LVLDEPASSLDAEGESAIGDAIKACRASDRSLLVITHRVKTVMLADRVVVLKEGQVAEQGTFSELQTKGGELVKLMPDLV
jgi:ABC-type multidrug transport system fused ATPase/permease subunit